MFDKAVFVGGPTHHHHTKVIREEITSGKTLEVYSELEKAAEEKILASFRIDNNDFKAVITFMKSMNSMSFGGSVVCFTMLKISGTDYRIESEIPLREPPEKVFEILKKDISEKIASVLLDRACDEMDKRREFTDLLVEMEKNCIRR